MQDNLSKYASELLTRPLSLPCGASLSNRIVKAAMTELLADFANCPTAGHCRLYRTWSQSGASLLITGNIQIDRRYLERASNVVFDSNNPHDCAARTTAWARAGTIAGNHLWAQLSHSGRQTPRNVCASPVAPSAIPLRSAMGGFASPRALSESEIHDIIRRFAFAARSAQNAGFTGIQIHAAHGYLLHEFLSPRTNHRDDRWGGRLSDRARLLLEVVRSVRSTVGARLPISVKLNAVDSRQENFRLAESCEVVDLLNQEGVDLIEISGGTYEQPLMMGEESGPPQSEAYFLEAAREIRKIAKMPLMLTGGWRSSQAMQTALDRNEVDLIGIARPFCAAPHFPRQLLSATLRISSPEQTLRLGPGILGPQSPSKQVRKLNKLGVQAWCNAQILRLANGQDLNPGMGELKSFITLLNHDRKTAKQRNSQLIARLT